MSAKKQQRRRNVEDEPRYVVGMDAHSKKLAVSIWDWSDRFNACLHREIKCVDIEAMVKTYERHVDLDSITIIEASTNSANLKRMLNEAGTVRRSSGPTPSRTRSASAGSATSWMPRT